MDTKKAIVLGADNNYRDKLETTIKSICYHNRDLKFYIFNEDIPKEWFYLMEKRLEKLNCEILNIEIDAEKVKHFSTPDTLAIAKLPLKGNLFKLTSFPKSFFPNTFTTCSSTCWISTLYHKFIYNSMEYLSIIITIFSMC